MNLDTFSCHGYWLIDTLVSYYLPCHLCVVSTFFHLSVQGHVLEDGVLNIQILELMKKEFKVILKQR